MNDSEFERRTREALEESVSRLDGRTRSRLTQARYAALEGTARTGTSARSDAANRWWMPAGAVAASAVLAMLLWVGRGNVSGNGPGMTVVAEAPSVVEDFEMLADNDAVDLADADDYSFYEWAAAEASGEDPGITS